MALTLLYIDKYLEKQIKIVQHLAH